MSNLKIDIIHNTPSEASRGAGAQACDYKRDWLWVRFPFEEMKYIIYISISHSSVEVKHSIEFRHSKSSEFDGK